MGLAAAGLLSLVKQKPCHIESKSGQEHVLCIAGGDFLHKMFPLRSSVAAPGVRESTALEYSSSVPGFCEILDGSENSVGFFPCVLEIQLLDMN